MLNTVSSWVQRSDLGTDHQLRCQTLNAFTLKRVCEMRVAAGSPQAGMSDLTLGEVRGRAIRLQMADATVPEGVHTARHNAQPLADWLQYLSHYVVILKRSSVLRLENAA